MKDKNNLSPKAKILAEKVGHEGDVTTALIEDPSLIEGLSEYQKWRDEQHRQISCSGSPLAAKHGVSEALKKLKLLKKQKRAK